jgi:hydroxymethylpyrimidine pyrophosphatase-like HAD family hydrolase
MKHQLLALDYDGTLATDGRVAPDVVQALKQVRASQRKLVMVTGRELSDLRKCFDAIELFDRIVAENGPVIYNPKTGAQRLLARPPSPSFVEALRGRGVNPLSVGQVVLATREPHEGAVLEVIQAQHLELEIIFNKGAVMVLPTGMNKKAGLTAVLEELHLGFDAVVGVGDAENDHSFLQPCSRAVAVANALLSLKERVDWVTEAARGQGIIEVVQRLLTTDLTDIPRRARLSS